MIADVVVRIAELPRTASGRRIDGIDTATGERRDCPVGTAAGGVADSSHAMMEVELGTVIAMARLLRWYGDWIAKSTKWGIRPVLDNALSRGGTDLRVELAKHQ